MRFFSGVGAEGLDGRGWIAGGGMGEGRKDGRKEELREDTVVGEVTLRRGEGYMRVG